MDYLEFNFTVTPPQPGTEISIAALGELPFDSFEETPTGFKAYIPEAEFSQEDFDQLIVWELPDFKLSYERQRIEQQNWNAVWESNFEAINVDDTCVIRAPFHQATKAPYEIIIEPKMSFGTGHHETTFLMIRHLLKMELKDKTVCDMGCGTGVLAILASMKGAARGWAIDIDEWAAENTVENCERNKIHNLHVAKGDAHSTGSEKFDVYIANINRNILTRDLAIYAKATNTGGQLLLSGFYTVDVDIITAAAAAQGFEFVEGMEKNNWTALRFVKK